MMSHRLTISTRRRTAVIVTAAVSLTGCGVSGGGTGAAGGTTTTGGDSKLIAMSHCMRSHGVSNFPDPTSSPGGVGMSVTMTPGSPAVTVAGITFNGPAFTAAEKACHFGAYGSKPKLTEAQKQGMLRSAECMRTHGVPNFPDPTFSATGGVGLPKVAGSEINRDSPAFQAAAKACLRVGKGIPGGG